MSITTVQPRAIPWPSSLSARNCMPGAGHASLNGTNVLICHPLSWDQPVICLLWPHWPLSFSLLAATASEFQRLTHIWSTWGPSVLSLLTRALGPSFCSYNPLVHEAFLNHDDGSSRAKKSREFLGQRVDSSPCGREAVPESLSYLSLMLRCWLPASLPGRVDCRAVSQAQI